MSTWIELLPAALRVIEVLTALTIIFTLVMVLSYIVETRRRVKELEEDKVSSRIIKRADGSTWEVRDYIIEKRIH